MNKVTTIHLNGTAYQMEESAYEQLKTYLDNAGSKLTENPDKEEIMQDVEQAIADKCNVYINPHKNVLTLSEIEHVIGEMGPVESDSANESSQNKNQDEEAKKETDNSLRRLYKIKEGSMIFGVCNGLAAYFDVDVTLVRVICVLLTILTGGGWIAAYVIAAFLIPYANTAQEQAAAHGAPFNAQELVDQAKKNYADMKDSIENKSRREWRKEWREAKRKMRREMRQNMYYAGDYRYHYHHRSDFWDTISAIFWLGAISLFVVFLYHHIPAAYGPLEHARVTFLDLWYRFLIWLQK